MSVRPSVPPINTNLGPSAAARPPAPPPKSPLRRSRSGTGSISRRRSDGRIITLTMPTPLSALEPATPPAAEPVLIDSPPPIPTKQKTKRKQLPEYVYENYPRPCSPLQIRSRERVPQVRRESSLSRIGRRLTLSRRPSLNLSFRKNAPAGTASDSETNTEGQGQERTLGRRQSLVNVARRESARLKGILKSSQTTDPPPVPPAATVPAASVPPDAAATPTTVPPAQGASVDSKRPEPIPKKVGATWQPPHRDLERRQSASKLRSLLKPNPLNTNARGSVRFSKPGSSKDCPMKPSSNVPKSESSNKSQTPVLVNLTHKQEPESKTLQQDAPAVDIAPAPKAQDQEQSKATDMDRDGKDIISEIDLKHLSGTEARRLIRQHNREYFRSRIWDPALQRDFAGAYRLANDGDELPGTSEEQKTQSHPEPANRDSLQTLVGSTTAPDKAAASEKQDKWKRNENVSDEDWGRSVRLAMAKLENKISTEAMSDPKKFMKARRESAQLRAWIAAQRRTSEARLSALAMGRLRPDSPFEQAFVSELLRENDIRFKHCSNPMAEAEKLFRDIKTKKDSLLPHYTPFSQYPLLTPLEEIEAETKTPSEETLQTHLLPPVRRRFSVFDEKKAARREGREYKSLSTSTQLDALEMHEARCCGLWKRKAFVDKIS